MYHFIVNPGSKTGKARKIWNQIEQILEERKVEYQAYFTKSPGHTSEYARMICLKSPGIKNIVIVGGDGTANNVINGIESYKDIILSYIPTGSGNDLAKGLNLPNDPVKALERVLHPNDIGLIDHGLLAYQSGLPPRKFAVSAGMGYDADICYEALTSKLKNVLNIIGLGKLIYFIIGIKQVIKNKPCYAEITVDGSKKRSYKKMIFIANMNLKYEGGGLPMAPSANANDSKLTCCVVHDMSKLKLLCLMPTIFFAKHIRFRGVDLINCRSIRIKTERPLILHTDGEYAGTHSDVTLSCAKEKMKITL